MNFIWHTFFFDPVYNTLIFFIDIVPGGNAGIAIICAVVLLKLLLLPLSLKGARAQMILNKLQPKVLEVKEKYKDDPQVFLQKYKEIYKEAGISPFASAKPLLIQIPFFIAFYFAVISGGGVKLPAINLELLYPFIPVPELVSMQFLGMMDIAGESLPLSLLVGLTQFIQMKISMPAIKPRVKDAAPNFSDDFARSMQIQVKYVMPLMMVGISYYLSIAAALYFTISNITGIAQELYIRRKGLRSTE